jgi:hyaluronoglucosaminidase
MRAPLLLVLLGVLLAGHVSQALAAGTRPPAVLELQPEPKSVHLRGPAMRVPARVDIVRDASTDVPALGVVQRALRQAGAIDVRILRQPSSTGFVVRMDAAASARRPLAIAGPRGLGAGGYVLAAGRLSATRELLVLQGADRAGQFYAAQTLRQLLAGRRTLTGVAIRDWPSFPVRGVVEGFYGKPWTQSERLAMLDFLGAHKLNAYMYAPKDDPYHRALWREPYPASAAASFERLTSRAAADHVRFTFAISPGLSVCYSSSSDRDALIRKLTWAWGVGIRSFSLAFDDIPADRSLCSSDVAAFGTGTEALARAQASLVEDVQRRLIEPHAGATLNVVPTEYSGIDSTPYKVALSGALDPGIVVQWTGRYGISVAISESDAVAADSIFRQPLLLWDNYFVNDYCPGFLSLGALERHDASLASSLGGLLVDPMPEAEASKIGLATAADFAWSPATYDPARSWDVAVGDVARGNSVALGALRAFADANYGTLLNAVHAPRLAQQIDAFWLDWQAGDTTAAARLRPTLLALADAPRVLRERLRDRAFIDETSPWLDATAAWGSAAVAALDALVARHAGHASVAADRERQANGFEAAARAGIVAGASVQVAPSVLDAFVERAAAPSA